MVRVIFDPSEVQLGFISPPKKGIAGGEGQFGSGGASNYFEGSPLYQRGYGWFAGMPRQRGAGLGDIFRHLWRVLKPVAKRLAPVLTSAGKAVGEEGLAATARILSNVVEGGELKDAVVNEGKKVMHNLFERVDKKLIPASQRGAGRHSKKRRQKQQKSASRVILKPDDVVGRFVPAEVITKGKSKIKRKREDIFGPY